MELDRAASLFFFTTSGWQGDGRQVICLPDRLVGKVGDGAKLLYRLRDAGYQAFIAEQKDAAS